MIDGPTIVCNIASTGLAENGSEVCASAGRCADGTWILELTVDSIPVGGRVVQGSEHEIRVLTAAVVKEIVYTLKGPDLWNQLAI